MKHGDPGLKRVVFLSLSLFRQPTKYEQLAQNLPGAPVLEITRIMYWRRDSPYKVGIGGKGRANWKPWALARIQELQVFIRLKYHLLSLWLCFKRKILSLKVCKWPWPYLSAPLQEWRWTDVSWDQLLSIACKSDRRAKVKEFGPSLTYMCPNWWSLCPKTYFWIGFNFKPKTWLESF